MRHFHAAACLWLQKSLLSLRAVQKQEISAAGGLVFAGAPRACNVRLRGGVSALTVVYPSDTGEQTVVLLPRSPSPSKRYFPIPLDSLEEEYRIRSADDGKLFREEFNVSVRHPPAPPPPTPPLPRGGARMDIRGPASAEPPLPRRRRP